MADFPIDAKASEAARLAALLAARLQQQRAEEAAAQQAAALAAQQAAALAAQQLGSSFDAPLPEYGPALPEDELGAPTALGTSATLQTGTLAYVSNPSLLLSTSSGGGPQVASPPSPDVAAYANANANYVHQMDAELEVGLTQGNGNCGPASLTMALRAQGLSPSAIPGLAPDQVATGDGADVQAARYAMFHGVDASRDGVLQTTDGSVYSDGTSEVGHLEEGDDGPVWVVDTPATENASYSGVPGIIRGAEASGAVATAIPATSESIQQALEEGKSVVVLGNFVDADGLQKEGFAPSDPPQATDWVRGEAAKGHFVAVTGMTEDGSFIVSDPANPNRQPSIVTAAQLDTFMNGDPAGAVEISPLPPPPRHNREPM